MPGSGRLPRGDGLMGALEALDALRERRKVEPWVQEPFTPLSNRSLLCFDQSLASTGWAVVRGRHPFVFATGTIRTKAVGTGHESDLQRAVQIYERICQMLTMSKCDAIVHEEPPIGSLVVGGGTSSLSAAVAVRNAASRVGVPVLMVQAQRAKKRIVGDPNASKAAMKVALEQLFPHLPGVTTPAWNSDVRDAVALGVIELEREV